MLERILRTYLLFAAAIITVAGCKDPSLVGLDALPDSDGYPVNVVDTFTIIAKSELVDSLTTSNFNSGNWLIGSFYDPVFGISASTIYTQFRLPSSNVEFGSGATIDSVVMYLSYAGAYGNWDRFRGFQKLDVYELGEALDDGTVYYSNDTRQLGPFLTSAYFLPNLFDEVIVPGGVEEDNDTVLPALRIKLPNELGSRVLNSSNLASDTLFVSEFNGLAIVPDHGILTPDNGAILYVNMYSSKSRIRLYYHTTSDSTQTFDLEFGRDAATHSNFYHDYSVSTVIDDIGSTEIGQERLYVQAMAGMKAEIDFSTLRNLNEGRTIAVNKAELTLPFDPANTADFAGPIELFLTTIDTNGVEHVPVDLVLGQGVDYYGGRVDLANNQYVFNIGGHIQRILSDPFYTTKIKLSNSGGAVNAYRGILNGPGHVDNPMKLSITFTEIQP